MLRDPCRTMQPTADCSRSSWPGAACSGTLLAVLGHMMKDRRTSARASLSAVAATRSALGGAGSASDTGCHKSSRRRSRRIRLPWCCILSRSPACSATVGRRLKDFPRALVPRQVAIGSGTGTGSGPTPMMSLQALKASQLSPYQLSIGPPAALLPCHAYCSVVTRRQSRYAIALLAGVV